MKKHSVLVVDDDSANIKTLSDILDEEYEVFVAKNGLHAVETADKVIPDIILLDIIMPVMDGYEAIIKLKESDRTRDIPVIFITSLSETEDERKGLSLGAVDYITKPFSASIVKLRVRNQINMLVQKRLIIEKERAEIKNQARIDFLMRVSNEMLTQMSVIMDKTKSLRMSGNNNNSLSAFDDIEQSGEYLLRLIQDLLDVSGKADGSFTLNETMFSFDTMYRNILIAIDREKTKKLQTLSHAINPSIQLQLIGDQERLKQVITNILTNAIKFTPEYGVIHVAAHATHEDNDNVTLHFEITDNGIGIKKEHQGRIFGIFEQSDVSMSREQGGLGLGLPISKRIVEMMGGEIWVESEPGNGTKFSFTCKMKKAV